MINIDTPMPIQWSSRWAINKQLVHRSCDFFARIAHINIPYLPPPRQGSSGGHSMDLRKMGFIFFLKTYCSHILYQQKNMFSNFCSSFVSKQWIGYALEQWYLLLVNMSKVFHRVFGVCVITALRLAFSCGCDFYNSPDEKNLQTLPQKWPSPVSLKASCRQDISFAKVGIMQIKVVLFQGQNGAASYSHTGSLVLTRKTMR